MRLAPSVASMLVGVLPILWLYQVHGVPTKISVGYGVLVWFCAVLIKMSIYKPVVDGMTRRESGHRFTAVVVGLLSAGSELGVAAGFFWFIWQPETLAELIAIGAGAGMAEAVIMPSLRDAFRNTAVEKHAEELGDAVARNQRVQWLGVLERVFASMIHVSGRALVYLSIASGGLVPALIGFCGFVCLDGVGFYGRLRKWRSDDVRVLGRVEGLAGTIAVVMVGALAMLVRSLAVFA